MGRVTDLRNALVGLGVLLLVALLPSVVAAQTAGEVSNDRELQKAYDDAFAAMMADPQNLDKTFAFAELAARLRALARRPPQTHDPILAAGEIRLDPAARRVWRGAEEIDLPNKEFRLLEYLLRHPGRVLTRTMIAEHVWDYDFPNITNVIDVHIRQLRRRLRDPYPGGRIETVRGAGYRLRGDA